MFLLPMLKAFCCSTCCLQSHLHLHWTLEAGASEGLVG
uniref:Uncharacterized protein n=1 Tax=Physcomitrium patens TaxID=3218 RepID=A0A2K1J3C5_PHYPA|nr:hypothetical protein PHYPA_021879 [Physcomitrium patens]